MVPRIAVVIDKVPAHHVVDITIAVVILAVQRFLVVPEHIFRRQIRMVVVEPGIDDRDNDRRLRALSGFGRPADALQSPLVTVALAPRAAGGETGIDGSRRRNRDGVHEERAEARHRCCNELAHGLASLGWGGADGPSTMALVLYVSHPLATLISIGPLSPASGAL